MTTAELLQEIYRQAERLPPDERLRVAQDLQAAANDLGCVDDDDANFDLSEEQEAVIARRVQSIRDGTAVLVPADEVFAKISQRLSRR